MLYVGDADKHGWEIEAQIRAEFDQTFGVPTEWHRIALSDAEAAERGDPNAEVVPLPEMRQRVRDALREIIGDGYARREEPSSPTAGSAALTSGR